MTGRRAGAVVMTVRMGHGLDGGHCQVSGGGRAGVCLPACCA